MKHDAEKESDVRSGVFHIYIHASLKIVYCLATVHLVTCENNVQLEACEHEEISGRKFHNVDFFHLTRFKKHSYSWTNFNVNANQKVIRTVPHVSIEALRDLNRL